MDFPITELMDEDACYDYLVEALDPDGLACPGCGGRDGLKVHRRHRAPVLDYRCVGCGRVCNAFTDTAFHKTHRRPSEILADPPRHRPGYTTARLARELGGTATTCLSSRHRLQDLALGAADPAPLDDPAVEADEMYQNAGEKRHPARRPRGPAAPPRQQAAGARHLRQRPAPGRGGRRA